MARNRRFSRRRAAPRSSRRTASRRSRARKGSFKLRKRTASSRTTSTLRARSRSTPLIPNSRRMALIWRSQGDFIATVSSTDTPNYKTFACNNPNKPDPSIVGHQPYLYDQCTALYGVERTLTSAIAITFFNPSDTPIIVGIFIKQSLQANLTAAEVPEASRCVWVMLPGTGGGAVQKKTLKMSFRASRSRQQGSLNALINGSAGALTSWQRVNTNLGTTLEHEYRAFAYWPTSDQTPANVRIPMNVMIKYDTEFTQPAFISGS